ncbi:MULTISPECIES: hypothetical protein [Brevibacillus]|uniref:hypothetical protein n=1 Tax=Brevibacillus TaxID=55080 RepID=UPI000D111A61|nr:MULTISPECIES: hypothetical protein [Brevibacillus]MED1948968.1 hypothetical protein [Brevibacillus formosus]MED2001755.1 hypothetical protein [Brevibacillus formosus]MED2084596.1 hypothetical protein [Brevibacillus formosus]PSK13430.1 hypothetical protein C7R94_23245 [Brevibacillus sp. NRRL NRS-603]
MNLKGLLAQISDGQAMPSLNDFFYDRVEDYRPTSQKQEDIMDRIELLRAKIPDELMDIFLEIDEAYVDLMVATNMELYKKGFSECLQLVLSATAETSLFERKGEEH